MKDEFKDRWYESYTTIIYTPQGEIPQTKGPWTEYAPVEEMLEHLKKEHPDAPMLVIHSRCGSLWVEEAGQWLECLQIERECAAEHAAYIKAGICSACGACSAKEAETKCRPHPLGDTGDYTCNGDSLWEDEEDEEEEGQKDFGAEK